MNIGAARGGGRSSTRELRESAPCNTNERVDILTMTKSMHSYAAAAMETAKTAWRWLTKRFVTTGFIVIAVMNANVRPFAPRESK